MVQGIRSTRCALMGLIPGVTEREAWLALLGEPQASVTLEAETA